MGTPEFIQKHYYSRTASSYDGMHVKSGDEHHIALEFISVFIDLLSINNILDVGCGTGRAMAYLLQKHKKLKMVGVDPADSLLAEARKKPMISPEFLIMGSGEKLPFPDGSFDAICELGALHHVAAPDRVIGEMMRVAKRAIFLSDTNRFGRGPGLARWTKLLIFKAGLWPLANYIKTGGKGYILTEGDGLSYSYSVYDSLGVLQDWADRVILIPTKSDSRLNMFHPLLSASHILLCAIRDR